MKFNMLGDANHAGPVRLSDVYNSQVGDASQGVAASQKALYDAYNSLNSSMTSEYLTVAQGVIAYYNKYICMLSIHKSSLTKTNGIWNTIAELPMKIRPKMTVDAVSYDNNTSSAELLKVPLVFRISNVIQYYGYADNKNVVTPYFTVTYLV